MWWETMLTAPLKQPGTLQMMPHFHAPNWKLLPNYFRVLPCKLSFLQKENIVKMVSWIFYFSVSQRPHFLSAQNRLFTSHNDDPGEELLAS